MKHPLPPPLHTHMLFAVMSVAPPRTALIKTPRRRYETASFHIRLLFSLPSYFRLSFPLFVFSPPPASLFWPCWMLCNRAVRTAHQRHQSSLFCHQRIFPPLLPVSLCLRSVGSMANPELFILVFIVFVTSFTFFSRHFSMIHWFHLILSISAPAILLDCLLLCSRQVFDG